MPTAGAGVAHGVTASFWDEKRVAGSAAELNYDAWRGCSKREAKRDDDVSHAAVVDRGRR